MRIPTLFGIVCLLSLLACQRSPETQKTVYHTLINGQITEDEWANANTISIEDKYTLHLQQDSHYYYLAIENLTEEPFYTDMFVAFQDSVYNIHSSSQLGERFLRGTEWTDTEPTTHWGYINNWTSNTVLFDRAKLQQLRQEAYEGNLFMATVLPYDGFEFQFEKKKWPLENSKLRIEMRNMVGIEDFEETIYPANSERTEKEKWHTLQFNAIQASPLIKH